MQERVKQFIAQLPQTSVDNSFEVRWSLSELEEIVYDFINAHQLPAEFQAESPITLAARNKQRSSKERKKRDVLKEELMVVEKADRDDNLPQMVREYILHDRGNSIFLNDSFGNLPSPVNEGATIKKLFKFNEDDPMEKKRKNETKNQAIRIEGKKDKNEKKEKSPDRIPKAEIKMRLTEIDKIVFDEKKQLPGVAGRKVPAKKGVNESKLSVRPYEEEESYENPVNLSKMPGLVEDYIDIKSDYVPNYLHVNNSIGISKGYVHIESLELDESIQNDYSGLKVVLPQDEPTKQKSTQSARRIQEPKKPLDIQKPDGKKSNEVDLPGI